ncbi:kinase PINOID [Spatholobus suberectus]|nr:kinase PINOID [Spatholobus suberectus]
MLESGGGECDSEVSLETVNSTLRSSMSSGSLCSTSFSRLSFDLLPASPESLSVKPHRSSDFAYSAIRSATFRRKAALTFRDFHLLRRIGAGDIGTVYLCRLRNANNNQFDDEEEDASCLYAMKVVDKDAVALKKKSQRAEMERKILKMLDHPFLPTLYAEFEASHFSCIVMEFCSGGDLHTMRFKHPRNRFPLPSARFYAAEVLVALEYLHMLGIIYRDLKPENVLVRSDGHIMLSDFDLSLCSDAIPAVESSDSLHDPSPTALPYTRSHSFISPFSCFSNRVFRSRDIRGIEPNRLFVAEPVSARSCSFVGTHEYVSPEVAAGGSHGNAVDWWSFGVFIYELIYGRTPYAGASKEATLRNIVKKPLAFPTATPASGLELHARDLISGLLNKDPARRLGSKRGAADVKKHPFFKGLNLALIRMQTPPEVPGSRRTKTTSLYPVKGNGNDSRQQTTASFDFYF